MAAARLDFQPVTDGTAHTVTVLPKAPYNNLLSGRGYNAIYAQLNVSVVPASGAPTLDVYLQTSVDEGVTWQDIAHFAQVTTTAIVSFAAISGRITGPTTAVAASDGALAANTVVQGPFGYLHRLKYTIGGAPNVPYTFDLQLLLKE